MRYLATIVKICDGDCMLVDISLGLDLSLRAYTRIKNYDAPELTGRKEIAALKAKKLLSEICPLGSELQILTMGQERDKHGRILADWKLMDGTNVKDLLDPKYLK